MIFPDAGGGGGVDMLRRLMNNVFGGQPSGTKQWAGGVGLAVAVGLAYFIAARFGLALRTGSGVAVFWPAAGISVGALIVWGRGARVPVSAGVVIATAVSNLTIGRNGWLAVVFGFVNAGQALLTAGLIQRWFGSSLKLGGVSQVLGFLVASTIGAAVAALGAAIAIGLITSTGSPFIVWRVWFASCLLGIVTVAPLLVGIAVAVRNPPSHRELVEGAARVVMLAALTAFVVSLPERPWSTALPVALVFPVLLWIAVRCEPVFSAAAGFVVALTVIWSLTFSVGHFGATSIALADRILAAQTIVLTGAVLTLVLAALFAERRRNEGLLNQSNQRLQLALDGAELGAFNADLATGRFECDARTARIHGHCGLPTTIRESRRFVHRGDLKHIDDAFSKAPSTGGLWHAEYRVMHPPNHPHAGETRWVAVEGSIVRNSQGSPVGLLGVARDITVRKRTDQALAESHAHLELASGIARVGTFTVDIAKGRVRLSPGCAALYGLPGGTIEISRDERQALVHPDDRARVEASRNQAFLGQKGEFIAQFRIVRADNEEIRWLESRCLIAYDEDGRPSGMVGVSIDVTERKQAEDHKTLLVSELDHRVKNTLSCVAAIAEQTRATSTSMDEFLEVLRGRIGSLANTHALLSLNRWRGVDLAELVRGELAPCMSDSNTLIAGPAIDVKPDSVQTIAIVLHELTTNAAKYGALSNCSGQVSVRWHWRPDGGPRDGLVVEWSETGGPPLTPSIPGYGTSVIRDLIPYELGGTVDYVLAADGVRCRLEIPARWLKRRTNQRAPGRLHASS
jgi:PAS domain S-box-containing protein